MLNRYRTGTRSVMLVGRNVRRDRNTIDTRQAGYLRSARRTVTLVCSVSDAYVMCGVDNNERRSNVNRLRLLNFKVRLVNSIRQLLTYNGRTHIILVRNSNTKTLLGLGLNRVLVRLNLCLQDSNVTARINRHVLAFGCRD